MLGSSIIFNNALIELKLKYSILSINTNLSFELNEDLFKLFIKSLIWFISIFFLSLAISIKIMLGFDLFKFNLKCLFSVLILNFFKS